MAPQVLRTARQRLAALVDPALDVFEKRLMDDENPALAVVVARDVMDRAGYKATDKVEISGPDGGAIQFDFSVLADDEFATLTALIERITRRD